MELKHKRINALMAALAAYRAWQQTCAGDDVLHQECSPDAYEESAAGVLKAARALAEAIDNAMGAYR